jgi:hypothetical protein
LAAIGHGVHLLVALVIWRLALVRAGPEAADRSLGAARRLTTAM